MIYFQKTPKAIILLKPSCTPHCLISELDLLQVTLDSLLWRLQLSSF